MGFAGAILRYLLELAFAGASFPFGTLLINVVGCFALVIVNGQVVLDNGTITDARPGKVYAR